MPVSAIATPGVYATSSELIALVLLTFKLDGYPDLRVVNNTVDIISRGQVFEAVGFKINLINQDSERLPTVTLQIDNLDTRVIEYIRALPEAPHMLMEVVSSADGFQSPEQSIDFLRLVSVSYNALVISGQLVLDNYLGARFPAGDYTPSEFPALFGIAGAGTYAYGSPSRGGATLFDCPAKVSTDIVDISPYRRNSKLYGGALVESSLNGSGVKIGRFNGNRAWMIAYGIYTPKTRVIIEFDIQLSLSPVTGSGSDIMCVFHTSISSGSLVVFISKSSAGTFAINARVGSSTSILSAPFSINHRTRVNLDVKNDVVTMTVDSKLATNPATNEKFILHDTGGDLGYQARVMAWGYGGDPLQAETTGDWIGYISNMLVSSNDPGIIERQYAVHPTRSQVSLLLKCNDVTGGNRFTDSGYYGYGDIPIIRNTPTIQRSGRAKWDGYGYYQIPESAGGGAVITAAGNLNFGMLEGDFCIEFSGAPLDGASAFDNYIDLTVEGPLLIEGAAGMRSRLSINVVHNATAGYIPPDLPTGVPNDLKLSRVTFTHEYIARGVGGTSVPFTKFNVASLPVNVLAFGDFFTHYAIFRKGPMLYLSIDGKIVGVGDLLAHANNASNAYFGTTSSVSISLNGKVDCVRVVKGHCVYENGDFIPFVDEYPDATALPPGTEGES